MRKRVGDASSVTQTEPSPTARPPGRTPSPSAAIVSPVAGSIRVELAVPRDAPERAEAEPDDCGPAQRRLPEHLAAVGGEKTFDSGCARLCALSVASLRREHDGRRGSAGEAECQSSRQRAASARRGCGSQVERRVLSEDRLLQVA